MAAALDISEKDIEALLADGFEPCAPGGMTDYSIEELLSALENGEHSPNSPLWDTTAYTEDGQVDTSVESTIAAFSDEPWEEKTVEAFDFTEGMTPEERAEWEALENTDWSEMFAETEAMITDTTASLDGGGGECEGEYGAEGEGEYSAGEGITAYGEWPDNEFTRIIPKPDIEIAMTVVDEYSFTVAFGSMTKAQATDYVEKLKDAGFTIDAYVTDQEMYGMAIYTFSAANAAGYSATLSFTGSSNVLVISK